MSDPSERSPGGSVIHRHEAKERPFTPVVGHGENAEAIEQHMERHFGEAEQVLHEIVSDLVHIDVHVIPPGPGPGREWHTLYTTGMSDLPMTVPEGTEDFRLAELMLFLPASWRMDLLQVTPPPTDLEQWYWPIRWLKQLARFPHEYGTWLGHGHSIPNGNPPEPLAERTRMCGFLLLPPLVESEEAGRVSLPDGRFVHLYVLHALHPEEMNLKLNRGTGALLDAFDKHGLSEVLDPARTSCVRRKLFGLF